MRFLIQTDHCMNTDADLYRKVTDEFNWNPMAQSASIRVDIRDGVMTLAGCAASYAQKQAIGEIAEKISGVRCVINQMRVSLTEASSISDETLAQVVRFALDHAALLAPGSVNVAVEDGVVALSGELTWDYQRREALRAAGAQRGVREVLDRMSLAPPNVERADSEAIINALRRNAMFDAEWNTVESYKGCVILRGSVRSWHERKWAERIAWCAQGTSEVINQLSVAG